MLKTKSVYAPIAPENDGLRILATRYRGRRMPANLYDVWMPSLGPSDRLLKGVLAAKVTWAANIAAPDSTRTDENVAGSIVASRSASRHRMEFTAKARSARGA